MLNFIFLQANQNLSEGIKVVDATVEQEGLIKELFATTLKGGPIMIPIIVLSLVAIFIFLERYITIFRAGRVDSKLILKIREHILAGKIDSAFSLCRMKNTATSRMIEKGISRIDRSLTDVHLAIENMANMEISRLEKRLPLLASVVGGAPMLGLLGTMIGVIQAFNDMVKSGSTIDFTQIAASIYQALGTTVIGLIVGLTAYFAYNILVASVDGVIYKLKSANSEFMDMLNETVR
jgi:biopolymer transport protein ExbB